MTNVSAALPCSYNPYDGPNDNPEVELPLTAGEYIYVYGDMDDDGFYEGSPPLLKACAGTLSALFNECGGFCAMWVSLAQELERVGL